MKKSLVLLVVIFSCLTLSGCEFGKKNNEILPGNSKNEGNDKDVLDDKLRKEIISLINDKYIRKDRSFNQFIVGNRRFDITENEKTFVAFAETSGKETCADYYEDISDEYENERKRCLTTYSYDEVLKNKKNLFGDDEVLRKENFTSALKMYYYLEREGVFLEMYIPAGGDGFDELVYEISDVSLENNRIIATMSYYIISCTDDDYPCVYADGYYDNNFSDYLELKKHMGDIKDKWSKAYLVFKKNDTGYYLDMVSTR